MKKRGSTLDSIASDATTTISISGRSVQEILKDALGFGYTIGEKIAEGSLRDVYEVTYLGEARVVKVNKEPLSTSKNAQRHSSQGYTTDNEFRIGEIINAAASHSRKFPGINRMLDVEQTELGMISVYDKFDGKTLEEHVAEKGTILIPQAVGVLSNILPGLAFLHNDAKVHHRDLKPGNIMVNFEGDRPHAELTDFSLAQTVDDCVSSEIMTTQGSHTVYDPLHWPSGLTSGEKPSKYTFQSELYQLAKGILDSMSAKPTYTYLPHEGIADDHVHNVSMLDENGRVDVKKHERAKSMAIDKTFPWTPRSGGRHLRRFLEKSLTLRPEKRYQSIEDAIKDINKARKAPRRHMATVLAIPAIAGLAGIGYLGVHAAKENVREANRIDMSGTLSQKDSFTVTNDVANLLVNLTSNNRDTIQFYDRNNIVKIDDQPLEDIGFSVRYVLSDKHQEKNQYRQFENKFYEILTRTELNFRAYVMGHQGVEFTKQVATYDYANWHGLGSPTFTLADVEPEDGFENGTSFLVIETYAPSDNLLRTNPNILLASSHRGTTDPEFEKNKKLVEEDSNRYEFSLGTKGDVLSRQVIQIHSGPNKVYSTLGPQINVGTMGGNYTQSGFGEHVDNQPYRITDGKTEFMFFFDSQWEDLTNQYNTLGEFPGEYDYKSTKYHHKTALLRMETRDEDNNGGTMYVPLIRPLSTNKDGETFAYSWTAKKPTESDYFLMQEARKMYEKQYPKSSIPVDSSNTNIIAVQD